MPSVSFRNVRYVSLLADDLRIRCSDGRVTNPEHEHVKGIAWGFLMIWPIGVPLLYTTLLLRSRGKLVGRKPSPMTCAIGFLHAEYQPHLWFWEVLDLLRKLVLIGWLLLVDEKFLLLRLLMSLLWE